MKHSYYEDILLTDKSEISSRQQEQDLNEHIISCSSCREKSVAWGNVDRLLNSAPQIAPQPGFSRRWQERLDFERQQRERLQTWTILSIGLGGSFMVLMMLLVWVMISLESPVGWLLALLVRVAEFLIFIEGLASFITSIGSYVPVSLLIGLGISGGIILSGLCGLWLLCMQKIIFSQRIEI